MTLRVSISIFAAEKMVALGKGDAAEKMVALGKGDVDIAVVPC